MAEVRSDDQAAPASGQNQPNLAVIAQYVKDLSFENPGAPSSLRARQQSPNIKVTIGVEPRQLSATDVEVELKIDARAVDGETVVFAIELIYAGLFRLTNIPQQDMAPLTLVECPRLLFPFARQVVSEAARNGGFPPLLIDPVDFVAMFRQRMAAAQQQAAQSPAGSPGAPGSPGSSAPN